MAASTEPKAAAPTEVLSWLKTLPLAPEYHPTLTEFQDPIAYIFKIEKEASQYGICKIVPPLPPSPKKTVISNLNRSLLSRSAAAAVSSSSAPTFTTRQQQIGFCPRKPRPVQKPVWQSGENYNFQDFEAKAKLFEKNYLKKCSKKGSLSPLEIETLYWKATVDKPFSVEYANDMPGSAFSAAGPGGGEGVTVGETAWNMRGVSRAKGSLLRFMKEEIPGVTSPMVYVAMLFSWFAWHVEDHDLHSLNYLHLGAGKTWYGVPREAAVAFEEVVRVHGYNGEVNPLVTFSTLGEKTTVISPEVFIGAGVPCCRLVQNAGEFVVTFPRAYHTGFSHGFNCGEAANIATPEWLRVAKDAAIRRASINYPPMVSHFQLLYDLALALCSRIPMSVSANPRSSRLKDKKKGEGETLVKELFVQNVMQNNDLLHILGKGSSIVLLPQSSSDISVCSDLRVGSQTRVNPGMSLGSCSYKEAMKSSKGLVSADIVIGRNQGIKPVKGFYSAKGKFASLCERNRHSPISGNDKICASTSQTLKTDTERESTVQVDGLSDQRLFSCAMCGILSFACVAVIQPKEPAARYLMSADCSFFNDWIVGSGVTSDGFNVAGADAITSGQDSCTRRMENTAPDGLFDVPVQSADYQIEMVDQSNIVASDTETQRKTSALGLLALTYGNSSDSEEEHIEPDVPVYGDDTNLTNCSSKRNYQRDNSDLPSFRQDFCGGVIEGHSFSLSRLDCGDEVPLQTIDYCVEPGCRRANFKGESHQAFDSSEEFETDDLDSIKLNSLEGTVKDPMAVSNITSNCFPVAHGAEKTKISKATVPLENTDMSFSSRSDEDSSRMHVFCLEHAVEVEQQLRLIGGVHIFLLCHPEYPKIEAEAKLAAEELGNDYLWNNTSFRDATKEDEERIQSALDSEEAIPGNGDWAVKLGINLFYSANLSCSPLYSKQMPYNSVIYNAFGRSSPASSPTKINIYGRKPGKQKKVVAGKWCGKVWMSNQVHPFLAKRDPEEQEQERSFRAWATPDENLERISESTHKTETPLVTRKFGRKRKMTAESGSTKKVKCIETEDAVSDDSLEDNSYKQHNKIPASKLAKFIEPEDAISNDSLEDHSHQQHSSISRRKQAKFVEGEDAVSYDSTKDTSLKQYRRIPRSKQAKRIEREDAVSKNVLAVNSHKQRARIPISKQTKCIEREDSESEDALDDNSHLQHRRIPMSKQAKSVEGEDAVSDDSLEDNSYLQHWRIPKSKQAKCIETEDAVSCDSLEDNFLQQHQRVPGSKQVKCIEREDTVSDDSLEDNSHQQRRRIPRSKQAKCTEREDAVSYDSLEDNSYQRQRIIPRKRQAKSIQKEDEVSYDSLEDNSYQRQRIIPRKRQAKSIPKEDEVSYDSPEDNSHRRQRRIPRKKQAKCIDREDAVSYDSLEDNSNQQQRRIPKSKQGKRIEREDAVSCDSFKDSSHKQQRRTLRSKQMKAQNLRQMKLKTPQHTKQGTRCLTKQEIPRQVKQETNRLQNDRSGQLDSYVEKELEGGPSTRLRKRIPKPPKHAEAKPKEKKLAGKRKVKNASAVKAPAGYNNAKVKDEEAEYQCDMEGCTMSFGSKQELLQHKRNICPVKGCGKKFFSHKYLVQHRRVHMDDRPLKCPWKGCKMTFKWAWARTEHIRVHTGARPYVCAEPGCGQTFRFVSDFSRHKRKTGHSAKKARG